MKLLNTSKVSTDNKVTIIKAAADRLNIKQGDIIGFYEDEMGNVILRKIITQER